MPGQDEAGDLDPARRLSVRPEGGADPRRAARVRAVSPQGVQERDLALALVRVPRGDGKGGNASLLRALAEDMGLGFDPLDCDMAAPWHGAAAQRAGGSVFRDPGAATAIRSSGWNCWHRRWSTGLEMHPQDRRVAAVLEELQRVILPDDRAPAVPPRDRRC